MKRIVFIVCAMVLASLNLQAGGGWGALMAGSPPATGFTYYSAVFGGSAYVAKTANMTGAANGKIGLLSCWVRMTSDFNSVRFAFEDSGYFEITRDSTNKLVVKGFNAGASQILSMVSTIQIDASPTVWHHVLVSFDLGGGHGNIYIDGVDRTTAAPTLTNDSVNFTSGGWGVMASSSGGGVTDAVLCELYFTTPASWFDITNSANRDKFYNSGTGKPVDLGANGSTPTGTQPLIYFHNQPPGWGTNLGSGGSFTTSGTITDGGSNKP